jgi:hypothetical protein
VLAALESRAASGEHFPFTTSFVPVPIADAAQIPAIAASKGSAYPGQKEFSEADVAVIFGRKDGAGVGSGDAAKGQSGAGTGQGARALDPDAALADKKVEEPQSFLRRNWHLLAIGAIWMLMKASGDEKKEGPPAAAAAGGAGAAAGVKGKGAEAPVKARLQAAAAARQQALS